MSSASRCVGLLAHVDAGKTTLTEAMLYAAGHVDRQGKVEDGAATTDYDPEETKRHISISAAIAPVEWKGTKINVIDVPGYFDFIGEMMGPLRVVETAGIVVGAVVDGLWLAFLAGTGVYEIIPGFICGTVAAVVVSLATKAPGKDVEELFDKAVAYED